MILEVLLCCADELLAGRNAVEEVLFEKREYVDFVVLAHRAAQSAALHDCQSLLCLHHQLSKEIIAFPQIIIWQCKEIMLD